MNDSYSQQLHFIPLINAFKHMWPRFNRTMGRPDTEGSDYSHIDQADLDALLAALRAGLGADFDELCRRRSGYAFAVDDGDGGGGGGGDGGGGDGGDGGGDAPKDPWLLVLARADGAAAKDDGDGGDGGDGGDYGGEEEGDDDDDDDDGDDPDEDPRIKTARWYRDVTSILARHDLK